MFTAKTKSQVPQVRRAAGQSLREEWSRLMDDRLVPYVFGPAIIWTVCLVEWTHAWQHTSPAPRTWTSLAIIATGLAAIGLLRLIPQARNLVRGERGELKVAETLEDLRADGYRVFHDLVRDGFNIDHVVVGPSGVYAIETKFRSGFGTIQFRNGQGLFVNDAPWLGERDPVAQARGNAADVRKLIKQTCHVHVSVTALVVFVGEWKVKEDWQTTDARVLSEAQLLRYFQRQDQPELTRAEIKLIASHLERSAKS